MEVLAWPGQKLETALQPGDVLVRVACGQPGLGHFAVLVDGRLLPRDELVARGATAETATGASMRLLSKGTYDDYIDPRARSPVPSPTSVGTSPWTRCSSGSIRRPTFSENSRRTMRSPLRGRMPAQEPKHSETAAFDEQVADAERDDGNCRPARSVTVGLDTPPHRGSSRPRSTRRRPRTGG